MPLEPDCHIQKVKIQLSGYIERETDILMSWMLHIDVLGKSSNFEQMDLMLPLPQITSNLMRQVTIIYMKFAVRSIIGNPKEEFT